MKTLSGHRALHCGKHQFHVKITVLEPFSSYHCLNKVVIMKKERKNNKNGTFATEHFCVQLSSVRLLGNYMSLADHKSIQRGRLGA